MFTDSSNETLFNIALHHGLCEGQYFFNIQNVRARENAQCYWEAFINNDSEHERIQRFNRLQYSVNYPLEDDY